MLPLSSAVGTTERVDDVPNTGETTPMFQPKALDRPCASTTLMRTMPLELMAMASLSAQPGISASKTAKRAVLVVVTVRGSASGSVPTSSCAGAVMAGEAPGKRTLGIVLRTKPIAASFADSLLAMAGRGACSRAIQMPLAISRRTPTAGTAAERNLPVGGPSRFLRAAISVSRMGA